MNDNGTEPQARNRRTWLLAALLVFGTLIIYGPALGSGFIWDDDVHFTANDAVRRWWGIVDIWTSRSAVYYPLVLTTAWSLHKVVGFNPFVFHAVTLSLHLANALLLVLLLRRMRIPGAWVAGFLFAWHPMQVESVAWVTELKNTQSAFFLLLSMVALNASGFFERPDFPDRRSRRYHVAAIVLFGLALLSKPSVVMVPVALLAIVWWRRGIRKWMDIDALFPFFMLSLLASGWTVWEQRYSSGAQGFEWSLSLIERIALSGQVFWFYLRHVFVPDPLMFIYPQWPVNVTGIVSWLPFLGAIAAGLLCIVRHASGGRYPGLVLWWFAVMLFPVMGFFNVYFMRYAWVADHFVYLPIISWCVAAGAVWSWLAARQKTVAWGIALAVLLTCGWQSHQHARTFRNPETLWRSALKANPGAWMARNNLGLMYAGRGDHEEAEIHYQDALKANPKHYEAIHNIGLLRLTESNATEALKYFDQALVLRPDLYIASLNRGKALEMLGDYDGAFAAYARALELHPALEAGYVNTALLAEKLKQPGKAVAAYEELLIRKNADANQIGGFLFERAYHLDKQGDEESALFVLAAARRHASGLPDIHLLEGVIHERRGEFDDAEKSYRIALSQRPDWGAVLLRLSRILAAHPDPAKRKPEEAVDMTEAMIKSGGRDVAEIIDVHAMALAAAGRYGDAMRVQQRAMELSKDSQEIQAMNQRLILYTMAQSYSMPLPAPSTTISENHDASTLNPEPSTITH